jgi:uncharacterized protein YecE (DUF72 family)
MAARVHIGISGWTYAPWRGVFFPKGLRQSEELAFAARAFSTIEINGTHYSLQKPASFQRWRDETPAGFVFSVKTNRYITHLRRLRDVRVPMANFFASGLLALREKLGPILWQFPPNFRFDAELMEPFLASLPRDSASAAELARRHDEHLPARAWLKVDRKRRLRHCIEVRHESFLVPEFFRLLRRHKVAFVFADTAGKWPYVEEMTADFLYLRLHGDEELYVSGYTEKALREWARRIRLWAKGEARENAPLVTSPARRRAIREIFVYFDNDAKVKAPRDAKRLAELLGTEPTG